ncbi:MAG: ATP-binding cassette domain-containing protein [Acidimicrobiia bacterium]|nr:ATP-binding cassette domain-containing protein [Acidimicrobiia bacterium]
MLSLVGLHKRFGDVVALDGAGFEVPPGRIVGFLGPNGAGKTTTMRCVLGLVTPDQGHITWNGAPPTHKDRLRFGYMPEERGLYPKMKIREQLVYFAELSGLGRKASAASADEWLERLNLSDRANSKLEELSHGNQQRVQLAVSLVHGPDLAVLDEPFAGLDPIGVDGMAAVLRQLAASGVGIVFSSHQLDLVEDVCEDVVIIDRGRVVLAGTLDELRVGAGFRYLAVAVDGRRWSPELEGIETTPDVQGRSRYIITDDIPIENVMTLAAADGHLTKFALEPPSLSDLFREAVGQ